MSATPSLGSHSYSLLDAANYDIVTLKNDSTKFRLDMGNTDYYSVVYVQTNNPISIYVNSSVSTAIPCQSVIMLSGGTSDITEVWVSNSGTSLATLKIAYGAKLIE